MKASLLLLMMVCFAGVATAQINTGNNYQVYMKEGHSNVATNADQVFFYDDQGPSYASDGHINYWDRWYNTDRHYTYVFRPQTNGNKIKVTFNQFNAYEWSNTEENNCHNIGLFSLRINDDELKVYNSDGIDPDNLIATLTGTVVEPFTFVADGPMTFEFISNNQYREEGWDAQVTAVAEMTVQAPLIRRETCTDDILLIPTVPGATIYYTTDGSDPSVPSKDPLSAGIEYTGPITWPAGGPITIKAIAVLNDEESDITTKTFRHPEDRMPTMDGKEPSLERVPGTNNVRITCPEVPSGINETFYVSYTTNNTEPSATNGTKVFFVPGSNFNYEGQITVHSDTYEFECTTPGTIIRARTFGYSCTNLESIEATPVTISQVFVDTPNITFTTTNQPTSGAGEATIGNIMSGATVYYTTDGSTPTPTNGTEYTGPFAVTPGQTVKAIAHVSTAGYVDSQVMTDTYIPGGESGGSNVYGSVVLLDDREPHTWSYYSDGDQPVHSLKPADVKITYFGYGEGTMTTTDTGDEPTVFAGDVDAEDVAVGPNEAGNQFIYLKTLENANEDGSGNYPYTLIPNPFSVRPTYSTITTRQVYLNWSCNNWTYNGNQATATYEYTGADNQVHVVQNTSNGNITINVKIGTTITLRAKASRNRDGYRPTITARLDNSSGTQIGTLTATNTTEISTTTSPVTSSENIYRGFYAWRVKRLSSGLAIQSKDGNTPYGVGDIIPAEEEIEFVAEPNSTDNEVEFEALWAQAYVVTSNTATGLHAGVSYERNFIVGTTAARVGVPVTYSGYYPDGTSAGTASVNGFDCNADTKFEYMTISGGTFIANNNNRLVFGRGLTGTAATVTGTNTTGNIGSTTNLVGLQYGIRLESGSISDLGFIRTYNTNNTSSVYGRVNAKIVLGSDYDRAKKVNNLLTCTGRMFFGRLIYFRSNVNKDAEVMNLVIKSGTFQESYWTQGWEYTRSIYCGNNFNSETNESGHYPGLRNVIVEGGELGSLNGGRGTSTLDDDEGNNQTDLTKVSFNLRIKGGTFHGAVFGGASNTSSWGSKRIVLTGGKVYGWIAGGANGTNSNANTSITSGTSFIYVGGDTEVGGSNAVIVNGTNGGQVFGAGRGSHSTNTNPITYQACSMDNSNVVIADNAQIKNKNNNTGNVYGGGNVGYITNTANVYILGGTVEGSVYGGAFEHGYTIPTTNVFVKGGTVNGSVYGGSNNIGTVNNSHVTVSGVDGVTDIFGGGYGESTNIGTTTTNGSTTVVVSGGTNLNNVYGGGYDGKVFGNTNVNISGGTMKNVYGAGMGNTTTAPVNGQTAVTVTGGTINNVYGGGQAGNVVNGTNLASTVTINGASATINENVFGGGFEGYTTGNVVVNLFKGNIKGHLFGGAFGAQNSVYAGGRKTVNMTGGHVFGHLYGGSRNAHDALSLTGYDTAEEATVCEINISAGKVDQNVYGAGYYGSTFGSVNVYFGTEAIYNAPNHTEIDENINYTREGGLNIEGTVYAGSDWGIFTGDFGASTITGESNVYVDGTGYNSTSTSTSTDGYMKVGISILGCGTSCDAGAVNRTLIMRNYATAIPDAGNTANPFSAASRWLYSVQRFKNVVFDNSHVHFIGQGKVNSLNVTEKYGLYEDETIYLGNGSTMVTNVPCSQIRSFQSVTCPDVYALNNNNVWAPVFTTVAIDGLGAVGSATDNKIRVNGGSYIEVKYEEDNVTTPYGELLGWAHMMSSINNQEATCAYARPKQSLEEGNNVPDTEDNPGDGGFVSYDGIYNQYTAAGALVSTGNQAQIRYENHTDHPEVGGKGNSQYFRIWRYGGNRSNLELVFDAHATGEEGYRTADVTITLPPFRSENHYYRFETSGEAPNRNTTTEYGSDVLTFNMAAYNTTLDEDGIHGTPANNGYMYYDNGQQLGKTADQCPGQTDIDDNPDVNFGLVIMPNTSMVTGGNHIICDASDNYLAELVKPFTCGDVNQAPEFTFRLTYNNELSSNMTWDPMKVKLVQCDANGNITDYVTLELVVVTSTSITQNFNTKVYAIMDGKGSNKDTYVSKIILPTYLVNQPGENSTFTITNVNFVPDPEGFIEMQGSTQTTVQNISSSNSSFNIDQFGLMVEAADTYDNVNVWYKEGDQIDVSSGAVGKELGQESGRIEVGVDVTLFYSGINEVSEQSHMGTVTITVEFDNYKPTEDHTGVFNLVVEVYRLGGGENFYVDGVNGKDATGYGRYPDMPAATVNYIFNRCNYLPGGNIFVVNTVTVAKPETWNGARFNAVKMFRYPGVHKTSTGEYGDPTSNPAFTGKLVEVTNELTLRGIVMDGMYAEATATQHDTHIYPSDKGCNFDGLATAPMINVANGGRINMKDGVALKNNYNTTTGVTTTSNPGGALSVQFGGTARMNNDAKITGNINGLGGGAWVDGQLIVSDDIQIFGNKIGTASNSRQSNVWLTEATEEQAKANVHYKVIQIGTSSTTDEYGPLSEEGDVKIGVDKEDWGHTIDGFMPVVYAEDGTQEWLELPYAQPQTVIVHDADIYKLEKYTDDHYLYWIYTWVEKQAHQPTASEEDGGVAWAGIGNITTANQLAWVISLVNGENGCEPDDFAGKTVVLNNDVDMKAAIWVPINNFKGTFKGNGHVIKGLNSPLMKDNMGMFGNTDGATITDVIAKAEFNGDAANVGTLIGSMKNTTVSNVEAAGTLEGKAHTRNLGGLVGKVESGTIHSSFSVNDMTANASTTVMGGLVGTNAGDLYNSFANTTMSGATKIGGLVGVNDGHVENCYAVVGSQTFPAFANTNNGVITVCYADNANGYVTTTGEGTGVELSDHGTYGAVETDIKALGYMYGDNLIEKGKNVYVGSNSVTDEGGLTTYIDNHIPVWNGLLSALNQWVRAKGGSYASWNRPLTQGINGDLPILAFPKDNCVGNLNTQAADGKMLHYSAYNPEDLDNYNGLDNLLGTVYNEQEAYVYLYNSASNVLSGTGSNHLFIHEDAALLQAASSDETITATVGITFDNSCGDGYATFSGAPLTYDWHFMSSSLQDAAIGATYNTAQSPFGGAVSITKLVDSYFPNDLPVTTPSTGVKWDLYTYYEPQYHWINLKRNGISHWHEDTGEHIDYVSGQDGLEENENETLFVPGKGYMMAISQDSYMNSTGVLNNEDVTIDITSQETLDPVYNKGWNLVGNPYQGYLDLEALFNDAANKDKASQAYVYDADEKVYVAFVTDASENPVVIKYLHQHQGFFVHSEADSTTLTFKPGMAKATGNGTYFRGDDRVNYPLVNLFAENARGNRDLAIIEFNRPELGGATKVNGLRNANFQIAASLEGNRYGLVFTPEGTEKVPVHFTTEENGTFTLTWQTLHGDFTSLLLVDNMTGTVTDMLRSDSYTFDATTDDYASRFYITYRVTDVDEMNEGDGTFAYFDGSEWIIEGQGTLDVVDVLGRTLYSERLVNDKNRVSLDNVAPGAYLLRVSNGTNTMVQKIVVR